MGNRQTYRVGLFSADLAIDYNSPEALNLLTFLFKDMPASGAPLSQRRFEIIMAGKPTRMSLWLGDKQLYFGQSKQELAHLLMNEVVYECIVSNGSDHAIHAAAISSGNRTLVFPGKSGSGKSSLAALLAFKGLALLTDELILLTDQGTLKPFTRPVSLKPPASEIFLAAASWPEEATLTGKYGTMIARNCFQKANLPGQPLLDTIIYPQFSPNQPPRLSPLSPAQSCLQLLACHVNARNLAGHGFRRLAALTKWAKSFHFTFGGFDDILPTLQPLLDSP
jgi:hypothetical protein